MDRFKYLVILILFIPTLSFAQPCNTGDIEYLGQSEIDNFQTLYGPCNIIPENTTIWIEDSNVANLDGLSSIEIIEGNLEMIGWDNTSLKNLDGLNVTKVSGYVYIAFFDSLKNIDALLTLEEVSQGLDFESNFSLQNLNGLANLKKVGSLGLYDSYNLTDLEAIRDLEIRESIFIGFLPGITDIDVFSGLDSLQGTLFIEYMDNLQNLDGLEDLVYVNGSLEITNSESITNLDGLKNLKHVGDRFSIESNKSLNTCCAICPLLSKNNKPFFADILDNAEGCNSEQEIEDCTICGIKEVEEEAKLIPTMGQWGIILLALLLLIISTLSLRYCRFAISNHYHS